MRIGVGVLERQVAQLRRLVDDLLDIGRITSGKILIRRQPLLLQDMLGEAVEAIRHAMENKQHVLALEVEEAPLWVDGDRSRLVQVVSNLLHNAAKFTPPGGRVVLSLGREDDKARLGVRDNGPGIEPRDLAYVFRLFAQGDSTANRLHEGLEAWARYWEILGEVTAGS